MRPIALASAALVALLGAAVAQAPLTATATLRGPNGAEHGRVTLVDTPSGVLVQADLLGLPPGAHGFHFHERGACAPDFEAAGGHHDPDQSQHGFLSEDGPHAGDMPNLLVPESGSIQAQFINMMVALAPDQDGTLFDRDGSSIVIHAGADDYRSQPAGRSGARIACGVVQRR